MGPGDEKSQQNRTQGSVHSRGSRKGNGSRRETASARDTDKEQEKCDVMEGTEKKTFQGENH